MRVLLDTNVLARAASGPPGMGNADVLGTRDRHLLRKSVVAYCQQQGVTILNDAATLAVLRQTPVG